MKKLVAVALLLMLLASVPVSAGVRHSEYEYYIRDYHVGVTAHADRSYEITETLTVFHNREMHGIIRDILGYGEVEQSEISDVTVEGAPYELEWGSDRVSVRIGDPDQTVTGEKTYVIRYRLNHYADGDPDYDYLYLDLIPDGFDVPIDHFSAEILLPPGAKTENYSLAAGGYGAETGSEYAEVDVGDGRIFIDGIMPLQAYEGVTIEAALTEGAFSGAEIRLTPVVVHRVDVTAKIDEYGVLTVREQYDATINDANALFFRDVYSDGRQRKTLSARWTKPSGELYNGMIADFLDQHAGQRVQFSYEYRQDYRIEERQHETVISLSLPAAGRDVAVENVRGFVTFPSPPISWGLEGAGGEPSGEADGALSEDGLSFAYDGSLPAETAALRFGRGVFLRRGSAGDVLAPLLSFLAMAAAAVFAFFVKREKPLTPAVEFYPPKGMSPLEMGYIIDRTASGRDVTSLIYFWASKGYLSIEVTGEGGHFVLHKIREIEAERPGYERQMFDELWRHGANGMVSDRNLAEKFYRAVGGAAAAVRRSFTGQKALESPGRRLLSVLLFWLSSAAMCLCFPLLAVLWGFPGAEWIAPAAFFVIGLAIQGVSGHWFTHRHKNGAGLRMLDRFLLSLLPCLLILTISQVFSGQALSIAAALATALSLTVFLLALPFLRRRTDFGIYVTELAVGFKMFLTAAEKSRLEMLLEENPDYYYDILPYAQVLGVSDIWEKKFDGLLKQPPAWYYGPGVDDTAMTYGMARMMSAMTRNMTSSPVPQSDSGGSFGGGGGGFSGGGSFGGGASVGGGSGGGGGRGW